jgi:TolB-like protein
LSRFRRPALGLGLGLAVVAALAAWWWLREPRPDRRRVAVAVFANRTGDSTLEPLGSMAADWVTRGLAQSELVDVVDVGAVYVQGRSPQGTPTDPHRLALQNGAGTVISGSYYVATDTLVIRASVEDAVAGTVLQTVAPVHAPAGAAVRALDQLREQVIVAVAGVFDARYSAFTARPSAPSFAAYQSFVAGQTAYWQGRPPPEVRGHFDRAAREDSTFLAPVVWLAFIGANGAGCAVTDSVGVALESRRESLAPFDRLTLELSAAKCRNDWNEGFRLATEQAALKPRSAYAIYTAGFFAVTSSHPRAARDLLRSIDPARDLGWISDPAKTIYWRDYAAAEHLLGEYRSELRHAERQLRDYPGRLTTQLFAIRALAGLGRGAEALARLEEAMRCPMTRLRGSRRMTPALRLPGGDRLRVQGHRPRPSPPSARSRGTGRSPGWPRARATVPGPLAPCSTGWMRRWRR